MNYHATIKTRYSDELYKSIKVESISRDRSEIRIIKGKDITFDIISGDATALRATMDAISKLLIVFEKMKNVN